jgi:hypothetical protein
MQVTVEVPVGTTVLRSTLVAYRISLSQLVTLGNPFSLLQD